MPAVAEPPAPEAEHQRIRRLFGVLDDVAHYTSSYPGTKMLSTKMLGHAWDRISELLQHADLAIATAASRVSEHAVGSSAWWRAIRAVASITDEHYSRRPGGSTPCGPGGRQHSALAEQETARPAGHAE